MFLNTINRYDPVAFLQLLLNSLPGLVGRTVALGVLAGYGAAAAVAPLSFQFLAEEDGETGVDLVPKSTTFLDLLLRHYVSLSLALTFF